MTAEIHLYVEGGGDSKGMQAPLRHAFGEFLKGIRDAARGKRVRWNITMCGGRASAFDAFATAIESHPNAFNVLLVDAEGPVRGKSVREHLRTRDGWENPGGNETQCHLMVQMMEAWLVADRERLAEYYGKGFHEKALPDNPNVEQIDKQTLEGSLATATRDTKKGRYHKTRHAPDILERIRPDVVRSKARFCDRLFETLLAEIDKGG